MNDMVINAAPLSLPERLLCIWHPVVARSPTGSSFESSKSSHQLLISPHI